jgi:hypothetical protein
MKLRDFTENLHHFADTASLIDNLDIVISVDTAVAHLAGALGKPVWLLNRFDTCWRWLQNRTTVLRIRRCASFANPRPGTGTAWQQRGVTKLPYFSELRGIALIRVLFRTYTLSLRPQRKK